MKKRLKIMLVDDHELVRQGLRRMLEPEEDMEVVADCANAHEAFSQAVRLCPDIVLMDVQMPVLNGIEATRRLKNNGLHCDADVIMLDESSDCLVQALAAGAAGYLNKNVEHVELAQIIRQVYRTEHSLEDPSDYDEGMIELVIPPPADAVQTLGFVNQIERRLDAITVQTVGSWNKGTTITILLKPDTLSDLLGKLGAIPGVERIEEAPPTRDSTPGYLKQCRALSSSRTSSQKRVLVILKQAETETNMATAMLN